ncbi:MAG: putative peptidoglycan glycosyltransferase FtsW [Chloroflexota bacterium]
MGTGTFVSTNTQTRFNGSRAADRPLLLTMLALLVFGLIMLFSASYDFSAAVFDSATHMFNRQLLWLALGIAAAFVLARFDYHHWRKLAVPIMLVTMVLLIGVLLMNEIRLGAKRSYFEGSIQPSELAKLVTVIYLSVWLYAKRELLHDIQWGLIPLGVILGLVGGLIYIQPDLSAAGTVLILGGLLFFLAGGDLKQIGLLLIAALAVGWLVVQVSPTGQERIGPYLAGLKDPTQASYHVLRSFEAIVHGGFFGVGLGNAITKHTGLPVPPTDSIFAVVVEELGLFGALILMGFYALLVWRGLVIARRAPDMLGTLLATGLVLWIGIEALINMAVMVGLMPFAGNALPFVSAGGSNLVASLAAIGILLNVSRQRGAATQTDETWRSFGETADLRRRNGRRGLPRARRTRTVEG